MFTPADSGDVKQASQDSNNNPLRLYDKIRVLGRGSYGLASVHRRRHDRSLVVLKEIDLLRFKDEHERASAVNEVEIMSSLDHPNIIKYFNAYATDSKLVIEMEYANFGTLSAYLSLQSLLEESEILIIFKQITCGLEYLHSKDIIHLDLKMENIFLTNDGLIKIGDFGIAKHMSGAQLGGEHLPSEGQNSNRKQADRPSTFQCTLAFSSPERCLGQATCFKSDIWSLGCILYELITSKPLFSATSIAQLILNITHISYAPINRPIEPRLMETFHSMIKAKPEERPTASQLVKIVDQLISDCEAHHRMIQLPGDHLKPLPIRGRRRAGSLLTQNRAAIDAQDNISSELIWRRDLASQENTNHLFYPHSIIYQVSLSGPSVMLNRIQMPQCKRIRQLVRGKSHYLALTYDFIVFGWGSRHRGQLGGCNLSRTPTVTPADEGITIASGLGRRCTLDLSRIELTNMNRTGTQLDLGDNQDRQTTSKPFVISELNHRKISQVAAGNNFSVFLSKTGIVMTCGQGSSGCLGHGQLDDRNKPQMVESLLNKDVVYIAAGSHHVIAVCGNGHAYAWGRASYGRLGLALDAVSPPTLVSTPQQVEFPSKVVIKFAYCGPRATIFIDSKRRCWTCGQNRHNRLGLDQVRRFKRTKPIEEAWTPQEIVCLSKIEIISCSIGTNHCTFLSSDSKMYVLGKDIDCPLGANTIPTSQALGPIEKVNSMFSEYHSVSKLNQQYRAMDQKNDELTKDSKGNQETVTVGDRKSRWFMGYSQAVGSVQQEKRNYIARKMPMEMVQSIAIGNRFSLASTSDNKVYFWGTRSYCHEGTFKPRSYAPEPQLISNPNDDCVIKIATTNQSFMDTIQQIGSDYPILHTQDPRLIINNMSEMWILDHQSRSQETSSISSTSSACESSSLSTRHSSDGSDSISCCSTCCSLSSPDKPEAIQTGPISKVRNDVILEPQTILSLYVPAMFNHPGNTLRIARVYCFDEDRFYLVLDTTIRNSSNHPSRPLLSSSAQALSLKPKRHIHQTVVDKTKTDQLAGQARRSRPRRASLPVELDKSPREISRILTEERIKMSSVVGSADQAQSLANKSDQNQTPEPEGAIYEMTEANSPVEHDSAIDKVPSTMGSPADDDVDTDDEPTQVGDIVVGSSLGLSLDEPRSLSTFANNSNETQIVIGPKDKKHTIDHALKPITKTSILGFSKRLRRKRRQREDIKSESTTGNEADETSAMPSWVINEFMENQQKISDAGSDRKHKRDRDQSKASNDETIFQIESSTEVPVKGDDPSSLGTDHTEMGAHDVIKNPLSHCNGQPMILTADIPEVFRPRAKSFGESVLNNEPPSMGDHCHATRSRPTSLNVSQQWQSSNEYLSSCGYDPNMSWLPSGMDSAPRNTNGRQSNPASPNLNSHQRLNPVTSLRKSIIKLFR